MVRLVIPPVTKYALVVLFVLSWSVFFLRYYTYIVLVSRSGDNNSEGVNEPISPDVPHPGEILVPLLTLVPQGLGAFYPWTLVTSAFVEPSPLPFFLVATTLFYGGRYCEHVWGSAELARFLLILSIVPSTVVYLFYTIMHWAMFSPTDEDGPTPGLQRFQQTVCGSAAILTGFLVAFKQLVPEHMIFLFKGRLKVRVKRLPALFLLFSTLGGILGSDVYAILTWTGFFVSWVYLRFYRVSYVDPLLPFSTSLIGSIASPSAAGGASLTGSSITGIRVQGDASDAFSMSSFFPEPVSFVVETVSEKVFGTMVLLGACTAFTTLEIDNANSRAATRMASGTPLRTGSLYGRAGLASAGPAGSEPSFMPPLSSRFTDMPRGSARVEAERRRTLALRALGSEDLPLAPGPAVLPHPMAGKD